MGSKPSKTKSESKEPEQGFSSTDSHTEDALIEKVVNVVKTDENDTDNYGQKDPGSLDGSEDAVLKAANDLDKDVIPEGSGPIECKYYRTAEGCKDGKSCRYWHHGEESQNIVPELNFLGLPIRLGEKDCPFYMRNGTCRYGSRCACNHPDPTPVTGMGSSNSSADDKFGRQLSHPLEKHNGLPIHFSGASQQDQASRILNTSSANTTSYPNSSSSYVTPYTPPQHMQKQSEWNGYQAPDSHQSANYSATPAADGSLIKSYITMPDEEFPERPGHPKCDNFVKSGNCKFRSTRHHRPKDRKPKPNEHVLSEKGLPLRPLKGAGTENLADTGREEFQNIVPELNFLGLPIRLGEKDCPFYMRNGTCRYGSRCACNHPDPTPVTGMGSSNSSADDKFGRQLSHPLEKHNGLPIHFSGASQQDQASRILNTSSDNTTSYPNSSSSYVTPYTPPQHMQKQSEWNGYQAPNSHQSANYSAIPAADGSLRKSYITMPDEEFHERPGHPKCDNFVKSGNCKFKSTRRHGPKDRKPKPDEHVLSEKGLPLRPAPDSLQIASYSATPAADGSLRKSYITMPDEEFHERPGHPKCDNFVKSGNCKFKSTRRHGPKDRKPKPDGHVLSEKGLPLRPPKGGSTENIADTGGEESQNIVPELNFLGLPIRLAPDSHQIASYSATPAADDSLRKSYITMPDEEFHERPGHPKCDNFVKSGNCKFKSTRRHGPKDRKPKPDEHVLSEKGLPLRPGRSICQRYERHGDCKFGNACHFDHPVSLSSATYPDRDASKTSDVESAGSWGDSSLSLATYPDRDASKTSDVGSAGSWGD